MRLISPAACLQHNPGAGHPEQPARLSAALQRLKEDFPALEVWPAPAASDAQLLRVHTPALLAQLKALAPLDGVAEVDADTRMNKHSLAAAQLAAGAVIDAVERVWKGSEKRVFCAVRPPGHHAETDRAMGFCLFNSVAVGAAHALALGCERISVVDFDVHHGNGTQEIFYRDPRVQYLSSHQMPLYPGTGGRQETGAGNIFNEPLASGSGEKAFRQAWDTVLLPAMAQFSPQLILVSAGFDGHSNDPLAGLCLETDDFRWLTQRLLQLAHVHTQGRIVSSLEGGYELDALAACVSAHVAEFLHFDSA